MSPLYNLPPELMRNVTDRLTCVEHLSLRIASKTLWQGRDNLPKPTKTEWLSFNRTFEAARTRRQRPNLICNKCARLLPKSSFEDGTTNKRSPKTRACLVCYIYCGDKRLVYKDGVKSFGCKGCFQIFSVGKGEPHSWGMGYTDHLMKNMRGRLCSACWKRLFGRESAGKGLDHLLHLETVAVFADCI